MRARYLLIGVAALAAMLPMASLVNAATNTTTHEVRISELEAKVLKLEALLEQQYRELDESCARVSISMPRKPDSGSSRSRLLIEGTSPRILKSTSYSGSRAMSVLAIRFHHGFDMHR